MHVDHASKLLLFFSGVLIIFFLGSLILLGPAIFALRIVDGLEMVQLLESGFDQATQEVFFVLSDHVYAVSGSFAIQSFRQKFSDGIAEFVFLNDRIIDASSIELVYISDSLYFAFSPTSTPMVALLNFFLNPASLY